MAVIAMSAFLLSAPKLLGLQWELFRWIIPVFVFIVVCKLAAADDQMTFVQPLLTLLFFWISCSMENRHAEEPADSRSKGVKVSPRPSPPPQRRKTRKDKKKKHRMMERLKDDDPAESAISAHRPMQPLPEFHSLNMAEPEIYAHLCPLLLSRKQLLVNDYPMDSPDCPGRVFTRSSLPGHVTERKCARCRGQFEVIGNVYSSGTECVHHFPVKRCPITGRYECCQGDQWSVGCMVSAYHVTAQHSFDGVPFHRIREKRQVKGGAFCNVFSLDCEMSYTTAGLEVVKVGLVGLDGLTVYETYVKPENTILDYNTYYSGVTAEHLKRVTTSLADVQAYLLKNLNKNSILVGHALSNDLKALRIIHERVVDTSVVFPHQDNASWKYSLRTLARRHLGKEIQDGQHDCVEDARTSLALVLKKIGLNDENRNSFLLNGNVPVNSPARSRNDSGCKPSPVNSPARFLLNAKTPVNVPVNSPARSRNDSGCKPSPVNSPARFLLKGNPTVNVPVNSPVRGRNEARRLSTYAEVLNSQTKPVTTWNSHGNAFLMDNTQSSPDSVRIDSEQQFAVHYIMQEDFFHNFCKQQAVTGYTNCHSMTMMSQYSLARNLRC